jgi:hypothetical protein
MNTDFVIYNAQGEILRTGHCPDDDVELQAGEGEFFLRATASCVSDSIDPETQTVVINGRPAEAATSAQQRQGAALSAEDQLDLLWQAMDAGAYPKAEPFYSAVKASKESP